jgi:hypothetical protein
MSNMRITPFLQQRLKREMNKRGKTFGQLANYGRFANVKTAYNTIHNKDLTAEHFMLLCEWLSVDACQIINEAKDERRKHIRTIAA